jgi:hypothetical protein
LIINGILSWFQKFFDNLGSCRNLGLLLASGRNLAAEAFALRKAFRSLAWSIGGSLKIIGMMPAPEAGTTPSAVRSETFLLGQIPHLILVLRFPAAT